MQHPIVNLVEKLSGSEKRYIHLFLKTFTEKENINLQDFAAIEKYAVNKNKPLKTRGNISRLYHKILDILAEYHQENLNNNNIDYINLNRAKLLFFKGFNSDAQKLVDKILASPSGNNHLIKVEAIELRLIHAVNSGEINYLASQFENDKLHLKNISEEYTNLINYEILWAASKYETSSGYFFDNKSNFSEKQYQDYMTSESNAISPMAKILFNKLKGFESIKKHNPTEALTFSERAVEIFHQNPGLILSSTVEYLKSLRNYAITLNFNKKPEIAYDYLNYIEKRIEKSILNKNINVKIENYVLFVMIRMDLMINGQHLFDLSPEFESFEKSYQEMRDLLPQDESIASSYHFVIYYLQSETPRKALKFINYILKSPSTTRKDLHRLAMIAELLVHFKIGNIDLLESKLNSYKKFLSKNLPVFGFETEIAPFFIKIINEPENNNHFLQFNKTVDSVLTAEKKEIYKHYIPFHYFKK